MSLKGRFKGIFKSDFNKNFLVLISGSIISQGIPLLGSIVLVRFYSPEDFGVLAIFNAFCLILTSIINLRYEFAIPIPKRHKDAINISFFAFLSSVSITILLLILFVIFKDKILVILNAEALGKWFIFIPLVALVSGIYNILTNFSIRLKKFKTIAQSNVVRSLSNTISQIFFGILGLTKGGLLYGLFVSNIFGNIRLLREFFNYRYLFKQISIKRMVFNAKKYKDFPIISTWGILLNSIGVSMNNFFISGMYGVGQLGYYSYSYRYLNVPLSLISNNVSQLFFQLCTECAKENRSARNEFLTTFKKLLYISLPFFFVMFFFVEDLFAFLFGEEWRIAGSIARAMLPLFFFRSIFVPLSTITLAFEKQKLMFLLQFVIFVVNSMCFIIAHHFSMSLDAFLQLYVVTTSVTYGAFTYVLYLVALKKI
ncbi:lipopolysaccharide biosynthesis protein [Albibacterium profundi]|uniref:Oligosaccharide flippase family protein n=1 Tax=Albibacterium profundi TaxID=3134906 RepID=A0ABV5C9Q1_9SPHI